MSTRKLHRINRTNYTIWADKFSFSNVNAPAICIRVPYSSTTPQLGNLLGKCVSWMIDNRVPLRLKTRNIRLSPYIFIHITVNIQVIRLYHQHNGNLWTLLQVPQLKTAHFKHYYI